MNQPAGGWQQPPPGQAFGQQAQPPQAPMQQMPQQVQQAPQHQIQQMPQQQMQGMPAPGQQMPPGQQMQMPMGVAGAGNPFEGMTSGDQSGGARHPYLGGGGKGAESINGDYKLKIVGVKFIKARSSGKPQYIIEVQILESNQAERTVGMTCSIFINLGNRDTGFKHLAAFLASVYGYEPSTLPKDSQLSPWGMPWMDVAQQSIQPDQPITGQEIGCHVTQIITGDGNPWTLHTFTPAASMVIPPTPPPLLMSGVQAPMQQLQQPPMQQQLQQPQSVGQQVYQGPPPANAMYAGAPQQQMQPPPQGPPMQQIPQGPPMQQQVPQGPPMQQQVPQGPPMQQQVPQGPPMQQQPQQLQQQQGAPGVPFTPPGTWGGPPQQ